MRHAKLYEDILVAQAASLVRYPHTHIFEGLRAPPSRLFQNPMRKIELLQCSTGRSRSSCGFDCNSAATLTCLIDPMSQCHNAHCHRMSHILCIPYSRHRFQGCRSRLRHIRSSDPLPAQTNIEVSPAALRLTVLNARRGDTCLDMSISSRP